MLDRRQCEDARVIDVAQEIDLGVRLVLAAVIGAAIGFEREIHGHPAGMRTHILVSLGSALFTVMSIFGFDGGPSSAPVDPSRVAAQIVSGIGFLGAGAILKDGVTIRGLTTAASLWATAAVGLTAGTGHPILATFTGAIIVFSLWPLSRLADRLYGAEKRLARLRLTLDRLDALADVAATLTEHRLEIVGVATERGALDRYDVVIDVRIRASASLPEAISELGRQPGVTVKSTSPDE